MVKTLALSFCCADCVHTEVCQFKGEANKFNSEANRTFDVPNIWIAKIECQEYRENNIPYFK